MGKVEKDEKRWKMLKKIKQVEQNFKRLIKLRNNEKVWKKLKKGEILKKSWKKSKELMYPPLWKRLGDSISLCGYHLLNILINYLFACHSMTGLQCKTKTFVKLSK